VSRGDDDGRGDPDRAAILARRDRFVSLALSTMTAATLVACEDESRVAPEPCLSVAYPVEPAPPTPPPPQPVPQPAPQPCLSVMPDPPPEPEVVDENAPGYLTLNTKPWAKVSIDGKPFGSTPLFKMKLAPGRHEVRLVNEESGVNVKRSIEIEAGRVLKQNWVLETTKKTKAEKRAEWEKRNR